jgi:hypothetical protein
MVINHITRAVARDEARKKPLPTARKVERLIASVAPATQKLGHSSEPTRRSDDAAPPPRTRWFARLSAGWEWIRTFSSALGRQRFRGLVGVGADLPAHRLSEQLPVSAHQSSCRAAVPRSRRSSPGSGGVTQPQRRWRRKRIAEPTVRIRSPPAGSLRTTHYESDRRQLFPNGDGNSLSCGMHRLQASALRSVTAKNWSWSEVRM